MIDPNNNTLTTYTGIADNFHNPDRGFYVSAYSTDGSAPLTLSFVQNIRNQSKTLIRRVYIIPAYRNSVLPQSFLDLVDNDCEIALQGGVRLIPRFAYNWAWEAQDATASRIAGHLDQLKPILTANKAAIAFLEAGFMGNWGEWHHSTNGLETKVERTNLLNKILSVLPVDRMVALRYVRDKREIFGNEPLTDAEAFSGSNKARTGAHNDCFVSSNSDTHTYHWSDAAIQEQEKAYLNADNKYVVQAGETCSVSSYDDCPNSLNELARMRWSTINEEYHAAVIQGWRDQGCMAQIQQKLGYRFRLISANTPNNLMPGDELNMNFKVINDGWASPYNPHLLEVVLRHAVSGKEYFVSLPQDVRRWMSGETKEINVTANLPQTVENGQYQIYLNLPDPHSSIYKRPEYSIRFANKDVWDAAKGYNSLLRTVNISRPADLAFAAR